MCPPELDARIEALISFKARKLARGHGFRRRDEADIEQELWLHFLKRLGQHDPKRASQYTFAERVSANKITDLIRRANAQCRDRRREQYLEELPPRTFEQIHKRTAEAQRHTELRLDLDSVLSSLSEPDHAVALDLAEHSVADVTRRTGLSRQSVRTARRRIRRHLERCGVRG
jgi:RNA polymerase sigma factor (sigma-70 family)